MRVVTADSLNTLRVGQRARYTGMVRRRELTALVRVNGVYSRHAGLRIEVIKKQKPARSFKIGDTFTIAFGKHETLAVEDD